MTWTPRLVAFLLIGVAAPVGGQSVSSVETTSIEAIARAELARLGAPGLVLAATRREGPVHVLGLGAANIETGEAMTPELVVSVASVSKMVTAVTALTLVAEGSMALNVPVRTYLPELPPRLGALTLDQLLSHTAGLADRTPSVSPTLAGSIAPVCAAMTDELFVTDAGRAWGYSNTGYTLAGCAIEAAAGKPFPQVVRDRVFVPVGMERSTYSLAQAMTWPHSQGHDPRSGHAVLLRPFNSNPNYPPAGELLTTVGDLALLARALLGDGILDGKRVLPVGLIGELTTPRGRGGPFFGGPRDYGLGLMIRREGDLRIVEHEGVYAGFGASFALAPELGLAVIAVANARYSAPVATTQGGLEILAGRSATPLPLQDADIPVGDSAAALGQYTNGTTVLEIGPVEGRLSLKASQIYLLRAHPAGHLMVPGYRPFLPLPSTPLELVRGSDGRVEFIRLGWRLYRRVG